MQKRSSASLFQSKPSSSARLLHQATGWLAGEKVNKTHLLFTMFVQSVLSIAVARVPNALPVHRLTAATDAGLFRGDVVKSTGSYDFRYDRFSMWTAAEVLLEGLLIIVLIYNQLPDIFTRCKGIA